MPAAALGRIAAASRRRNVKDSADFPPAPVADDHRSRTLRTWAGFGTGQVCAVCGDEIGVEAVEVEAEGADGKKRFYHSRCSVLLSRERDRL